MAEYKSFTLSEVLISLVIIGIIAAITVPIMINQYQKVKVANQVKKLYSTFNQAIRLAETENGQFSSWEYENMEELFDKYISKHINSIQIERNLHVTGYCTNGVLFVFQDGSQAICGFATCAADRCETGKQPYACLMSPSGTYGWNNLHAQAPHSGYTKPTRQMFWFILHDDGTLTPPYMNKPRDEIIQACKSPGYYGSGYIACSTLLMKDGWEIKSDYPWNITQSVN